MRWFLERITADTLPINFGYKDKREHSREFAKLAKLGILKHSGNLDSIPCELCEEGHECQVRQNAEELFYVCENGGGKKTLTNEELAVYEYDDQAFLKLLAKEFDLKIGQIEDEAVYSTNSFYHLGFHQIKTVKFEVYYLRTEAIHEPSSLFEQSGGQAKVLITNATKPTLVFGKEGTRYCVLADCLAKSGTNIFDAAKFKECLESARRVRFDTKQGHLFVDEKLVYTTGLNSPEFHFLWCLWKRWQEQVPHTDIHHFVREKIGRDVADAAQKFCNKTKSAIKKDCPVIDAIITVPTIGHYMMADPT